jgi:hypothetical protein
MADSERVFLHHKEFPLSMRALYTGAMLVLGIGYMFAMIQIYASHAGRDGEPGLSVTDIAIAYSGSKEATRLEAALQGPMSGMVSPGEKGTIIGWVRRGVDKNEFEAKISPIIQKRCLACHDGSNPHIPALTSFEEIAETAEVDTGMDLFTLVRVSHIHLFGLTFIFFVMGSIFMHAYVRPLWFKSAVIIAPFIGILADIFSWYLTKLYTGFAWVVIISGAVLGGSFAIQWAISMYQIWLYRRVSEWRARTAARL